VPVFSSFGGGTESSKLYSGRVVVVVAPGRAVVDVTADELPRLETDESAGAAAFDPPLHAAKPTATAIRTPIPRFPTSRRVGTRAQKVRIGAFASYAQIHVVANRSTNRRDVDCDVGAGQVPQVVPKPETSRTLPVKSVLICFAR
jgi:hypothetical protein